jgi:hypothetical protein
MCFKEYLVLFLNLMIEYEPILAFINGIISHSGKMFVIVPALRKKLRKSCMAGKVWHSSYPTWWEKVVMTHVLLVYPAQGEKFRVALILS